MARIGVSSELVLFLYTIIYVVNFTVLPQLILRKICLRQNGYNVTLCHQLETTSNEIQKEAAAWWFYVFLCSAVPAIFAILVGGPISDMVGRKYAMIVIPVANALQSLVYLLNAYFVNSHPGYLLIGAFLSCFYGEFQGVIALCYAYLADITSHILDQRTRRMGMLEVAIFFAQAIAGICSGFLIQELGFTSVFVFTIIIDVVMLFYVVWCLPSQKNLILTNNTSSETHLLNGLSTDDHLQGSSDQRDEQQETELAKAADLKYSSLFNPLTHLKQVWAVVWEAEYCKTVLPLLFAFGFAVCALFGEFMVQVLYLKSEPFKFTPQKIGYYAAAVGSIRGLGVLMVMQLVARYFKLGDFKLICLGLVSQIICYVLIGVARTATAVFLVNIVGLAIPVPVTTLHSLITKQVRQENYGAVLAASETIDIIANILANTLSLWTYRLTLSFYTGAVYFGISGFCVIALIITTFTYCYHRDALK